MSGREFTYAVWIETIAKECRASKSTVVITAATAAAIAGGGGAGGGGALLCCSYMSDIRTTK